MPLLLYRKLMFQKDWILETNSTWHPFFETQVTCHLQYKSFTSFRNVEVLFFFFPSLYLLMFYTLYGTHEIISGKKKVNECYYTENKVYMSCYSVYCPVTKTL